MIQVKTLSSWKAIILSSLLCIIQASLAAWTTPTTISAQGNNSLPVTAIDSNGNGIAVWLNGTFPSTIVQAATYISGQWSAPFDLTDTDMYYNPAVSMDAVGNAAVVWEHYTAGDNQIQTVNIPFNSTPGSILTISFQGDNRLPSIVLESSGSGFAVWEDRSTDQIFSARLNNFTNWSAPAVVAQTGGLFVPELSLSASGHAITYWYCTGTNTARTATYDNGTWVNNGSIDPNSAPQRNGIVITIDPVGNAVAVWVEAVNAQLMSATRPVNGTWSSSQLISDDYPNAFHSVDIDNQGNAVAAWLNYDLNVVEAASFINGAWQTPIIVSNGVGNQDAYVSVDADGNATVVYQSWDGGTIQTVNLPFGGVWSAPTQISGDTGYSLTPTLQSNESGNSIAVWVNTDGTDSVIQASFN